MNIYSNYAFTLCRLAHFYFTIGKFINYNINQLYLSLYLLFYYNSQLISHFLYLRIPICNTLFSNFQKKFKKNAYQNDYGKLLRQKINKNQNLRSSNIIILLPLTFNSNSRAMCMFDKMFEEGGHKFTKRSPKDGPTCTNSRVTMSYNPSK